MIETDFVFIKPLQAPPAEGPSPSIGFPYGYIQPQYPTIQVLQGGGGWWEGWGLLGLLLLLPLWGLECRCPCCWLLA